MIKRILGYMTDLVFPPKCCICDNIMEAGKGNWLCGGCRAMIELVGEGDTCEACGKPVAKGSKICYECYKEPPKFVKSVSVASYDSVKELIYSFKYGNRPGVSGVMVDLTKENVDLEVFGKVDVIVPVPMYRRKQRDRGYNQAEIYARGLAKCYGVQVSAGNLCRIRDTVPQARLSATERAENVHGAFALTDAVFFEGKSVVLVDDVFTTGSTLNACADVLFEAGAEKVFCLTFAVTSLRDTSLRDIME